jgi:hypothetical protein
MEGRYLSKKQKGRQAHAVEQPTGYLNTATTAIRQKL